MKFNHIFLLFLLFFASCKNNVSLVEYSYSVSTMGTVGAIKYVSDNDNAVEINRGIDSVLFFVNQSMSTYIADSEISLYSKYFGTDTFANFEKTLSDEFMKVLLTADTIYKSSNGAFNPLVKPLIDYWGFGAGKSSEVIDTAEVLEILKCLDYDAFLYLRNNQLGNTFASCFQLDFSAIAKGYGVDLVANYLGTWGIENYMVEIGGEVSCKGKNIKNSWWRMGIEKPNEEIRELYEVAEIKNRSLATSGNYRNFRVLESGQKLVHIVNPRTGFPVESNLLSATIFAENCMLADAYATACMVMGLDACFKFIDSIPNVDAYLIYSNEEGLLEHKFTKGIENDILMIEK